MTITFIGGGNMAKAIIAGLLNAGEATADSVTATAPSEKTRLEIAERFGIRTFKDNAPAVRGADVVILAVKPQVMAGVLEELKAALMPDQLIMTIAAGKTLSFYEERLGSDKKLVRCMPNTPAQVGEGMTSWAAGRHVTDDDKAVVRRILSSFGREAEIPEHLIDAAGAVAGCAPAYLYMMLEAMADAGVAEGLPRAIAYEMAAQTMLGAAKLTLESGKHPGELKDQVTSPAGSTIAGLASLEEDGFRGAVIRAIRAAASRNREL